MNDTQIGKTDPRFGRVYERWQSEVTMSLLNNEFSMNFFDSARIVLSNQGLTPPKCLRRDIKTAINYLKYTTLDTLIVGYDSTYMNFAEMAQLLDEILAKRRRKDYRIKATNCVGLTEQLAPRLMSTLTPDLNFLMITYTGEKTEVMILDSMFDEPLDDSDEDE